MHAYRLLMLPLLLMALAGCNRQAATPPAAPAAPDASAPPPAAENPQASGKIKISAYINVTSGCQASTVALINELGMKNRDLVDLEIIDFGSPEGERRWRSDGLECMTILFNGSPVLRFPGPDGAPKTVVFSMPAGFSWELDDLKQAFAALKSHKLEMLTEEQARQELEPKAATLAASTRLAGKDTELQINDKPMFAIKAPAGGKTASQRAEAAKLAIDRWAKSPIHPSQLSLAPAEAQAGKPASTAKAQQQDMLIQADGQVIIRITAADAKAAGAAGTQQLATTWLKALKDAASDAVAKASRPGAPAAPPAS